MTDRLVVLIGKRRYNSPAPMESAGLTAFIAAMERFAVDRLGVDPPMVGASGNGEWIKFEFVIEDD